MDSKLKLATIDTLKELLDCFSSWEPEVCVLGNVKAVDAVKAIQISIDEIRKTNTYYRYDPPI